MVDKINNMEEREVSLLEKEYVLLLFITIISYTLVFSLASISLHQKYGTSAWGIGLVDQAFFSSLFHGKNIFTTLESVITLFRGFMTPNYSPIMFLLFPIYYLFPQPETLLTIQTITIALAAYPLFHISRHILKSNKYAAWITRNFLMSIWWMTP